MFYKTKNGDVLFTSQPYYLSKEEINSVFKENFESEFELFVYDTNLSWYSPGQVTLFIIKLKK